MQLYRLTYEIQLDAPVRLRNLHYPVVYAVVAEAWAAGATTARSAAVPDSTMIHAPERGRIHVEPGETYHFGLTIMNRTPQEAASVAHRLNCGLKKIGERSNRFSSRRPTLHGNFEVLRIRDCISGELLPGDFHQLTALTNQLITADVQNLAATAVNSWTLQFRDPLRLKRPKSACRGGHRYWDAEYFQPDDFLEIVVNRLMRLGVCDVPIRPEPSIELIDASALSWLSIPYKGGAATKYLNGAVGPVLIRAPERSEAKQQAAQMLALGQYFHIGLNTSFGLGGYTIHPNSYSSVVEPNQATLHRCERSAPMWDLAAAAAEAHVTEEDQAGETRAAWIAVKRGTYHPDRPTIISTQSDRSPDTPKSGTRTLAVPSRRDRRMQRMLLPRLSAAIASHLDQSSHGYRAGRSRHTAAAAVRDAFRDGYRWAVRADIERFFPSVSHDKLRHSLAAILDDPSTEKLVFTWLTSAESDQPGRGLPLGAPISPVLANLFLRDFDEACKRRGHHLIRFADDLLVLFKSLEQATEAVAAIQEDAHQLELKLNERKTRIVHLEDGFDYLGFRFEKRDRWRKVATPATEPQPVEELGWTDASRAATPKHLTLTKDQIDHWTLPAENATEREEMQAMAADIGQGLAVVGPGPTRLTIQNGQLVCEGKHHSPQGIPLHLLDTVISLDTCAVDAEVVNAFADSSILLLMLRSRDAEAFVELTPPGYTRPQASITRAQARFDTSPARPQLARQLIAAKLHNYAQLATAAPEASGEAIADELRDASIRATKTHTMHELRGVEGAAARRWFAWFRQMMPANFTNRFAQRSARQARDPANALLNVGYAYLYQRTRIAAAAAGLEPALGFFHQARGRHQALASDLMEPFRHLVDRVVLQSLKTADSHDFKSQPAGPYPVRIEPRALRQFYARLQTSLTRPASNCSEGSATYRLHLHLQARRYAAYLTSPTDADPPAMFFTQLSNAAIHSAASEGM